MATQIKQDGISVQYDGGDTIFINGQGYEVPKNIRSSVKLLNTLTVADGVVYVNGYKFDNKAKKFETFNVTLGKMLFLYVLAIIFTLLLLNTF